MQDVSEDPTFSTRGKLAITAILHSDYYLTLSRPSLTYPGKRPAVEWVQGRHYFAEGEMRLDPKTFKVHGAWVRIVDRGQAEEGVDYAFETQFWEVFRLRAVLRGVKGGTIVRPAIGLKNLIDGKDEWTYFTPKIFKNDWGESVKNPKFATPVDLIAQYNRGQQRVVPRPWSALNFHVHGYYLFWLSERGDEPEEEGLLSVEHRA